MLTFQNKINFNKLCEIKIIKSLKKISYFYRNKMERLIFFINQ